MWFNNEILEDFRISSVGLLGKVLDSQSRGWWKAWVRVPVGACLVKEGACLVEEADLQDSR